MPTCKVTASSQPGTHLSRVRKGKAGLWTRVSRRGLGAGCLLGVHHKAPVSGLPGLFLGLLGPVKWGP